MFNIIECTTYDEKKVEEAIGKLVDLKEFINKGERILKARGFW